MVAVTDRPRYAPFRLRRAWMLASFLGLSLVAVASLAPTVECRYAYVTSGGGSIVTGGGGSILSPGGDRCELTLGRFRVPLPPQLNAILSVLPEPPELRF
jgi:hypothetical protein